jgi:hypothetical protein
MKRYLFLAAWFDGCESSPDTKNGVHNQDDLMPRFLAGEKEMIKLIIEGAPNEKVAEAYGYRECWHDNMTAYDSVSNLFTLDHDGSSTAMYAAQGCKVITVDATPEPEVCTRDAFCRCYDCWR